VTSGGLADVESARSAISSVGAAVVPAPPSSVPTQTPIRLHSGIRAPQRLVNVAPAYPTIARSAHVEAALTAVRQWKFSPTLLNGVPVPIVMTVTVNFTLK